MAPSLCFITKQWFVGMATIIWYSYNCVILRPLVTTHTWLLRIYGKKTWVSASKSIFLDYRLFDFSTFHYHTLLRDRLLQKIESARSLILTVILFELFDCRCEKHGRIVIFISPSLPFGSLTVTVSAFFIRHINNCHNGYFTDSPFE